MNEKNYIPCEIRIQKPPTKMYNVKKIVIHTEQNTWNVHVFFLNHNSDKKMIYECVDGNDFNRGILSIAQKLNSILNSVYKNYRHYLMI